MHSQVFSYIDPSPRATVDGGTLCGKRATVQCGISVRGWPTEAGSRSLSGFVALEDATVVERLKSAGAMLVGNTRSSELGFGLLGDGAGPALKEGHADLALMTDTMGEARVAASSAGLFGFKPSYGHVSRFGLVGLVPSMDCCSILGGSLRDIAAVFRAIEGSDDRDPSMADGEMLSSGRYSEKEDAAPSAGIVTQCFEALDPGEQEAFRTALDRIREGGVTVREVQWEDFDLF
ncbi:MAG TPA: amidase, partial [Syntrophobacteraceae bacterium]|nr:amidase [Syntrophobacteraceae bacterium]